MFVVVFIMLDGFPRRKPGCGEPVHRALPCIPSTLKMMHLAIGPGKEGSGPARRLGCWFFCVD